MIKSTPGDRLRVILGARQSVAHDGSMSIESQHLMGETEGQRRDWDVVGKIVDDDVSGAHDPFQRPALGPVLRGETVEFDAIVFPKPDRASRDTLDGLLLLRWAQTSGKRLIILSPYMDSATMTPGERVQYVLGLELGSYEREQIIARIRAGVELGRQKGRYLGGRVPLWCKVVPHPEDPEAYALAIDEERAIIVLDIIEALRSKLPDGRRMPYAHICRALNEAGVPTPFELRNTTRPQRKRKAHKNAAKQRVWQAKSLVELVDNRLLIGEREVIKYEYVNGKRGKLLHRGIVRDATTNRPVLFCTPLIDYDVYMELQAIIHEPRLKHPVRNARPLQGIVFCMECQAPRNPFTTKGNEKDYEYSLCANKQRYKTCASPNVKMHLIYEFLERKMLEEVADEEMYDKIDPPKVDYAARLLQLRDEVDALTNLYRVTKSETGRAKLEATIADLDGEIAELEVLERTPPEPIYRATGRIFRQMWIGSDWGERGNLLRFIGIRVEVKGLEDGGYVAEVKMPEDVRARLRLATSDQPAQMAIATVDFKADEEARLALVSGSK